MSSANEIKKLQEALKTLKASKAADTHASRLAKKEGEKLPAAMAELEKRRGLLAAATTEKDKKKYEKMVETAERGVAKIRANIEAMSAGPKTRTRKAPANGASVASTGKRAQAAAARAARAALLANGKSYYCYKAGTNGKTGKYSGLLTISGEGEVDWVEEEKKISVASRSRATSRASSAASTRASSPVANTTEGGRRRKARSARRKSRKGSRKGSRKTRSARRKH